MSVKKNQENYKLETKKLDEKTFKRINEKFRQYWKYLFWLIFSYVVCYLVWKLLISGVILSSLDKTKTGENTPLIMVIIATVVQGLLFSLDGFVTALLKSPFNQMCFTINKAEGIPDERKDYIITKATESNEHCKETLKKFGILTITGELLRVILKVESAGKQKYGPYSWVISFSYLIPIFFAALDIWFIHKELKKVKKTINSTYGGK